MRGEKGDLRRPQPEAFPIAIIDDLLARRVARSRSIPVTGTLGILIQAKKRGFIESMGPLVNQLQRLGFLWSGSMAYQALFRLRAKCPKIF